MVIVDNNDGVVVVVVVVVVDDEGVDEELANDLLIVDNDVDHVVVVYVNLLDLKSNWVLVMINYVVVYAVLLVGDTT